MNTSASGDEPTEGDRRVARRNRKWPVVLVGAAVVVIACAVFRPDRALRVLTGFVAHTLCTSTFVSGLDPAQVYAEVVKPLPGLWLFDWAVRYEVDRARRGMRPATASIRPSWAIRWRSLS